jgi:uncharacterized protein (DUF849 family)
MDTETMHAEQAAGMRQAQEAARAELEAFTERLTDKYGELTDRQLLLLVIGWQYQANATIAGMKEQAEKLMANPMIASLMGQLD